jgi:hypothetical protein
MPLPASLQSYDEMRTQPGFSEEGLTLRQRITNLCGAAWVVFAMALPYVF